LRTERGPVEGFREVMEMLPSALAVTAMVLSLARPEYLNECRFRRLPYECASAFCAGKTTKESHRLLGEDGATGQSLDDERVVFLHKLSNENTGRLPCLRGGAAIGGRRTWWRREREVCFPTRFSCTVSETRAVALNLWHINLRRRNGLRGIL
jgi:hypothetical protein